MISDVILKSPAALDLHLCRWGDAESACFLVHGSGEHCRIWDHFAIQLRQRYCVYATDLRGHGDSQWDSRCRYQTGHHAHDLSAAIDALSSRPVTLVGHSLGADVIVHVAAMRPERVHALVLVDPGIGRPEVTRSYVRKTLLSTPRYYDSVASFVGVLMQQRPLADPALLGMFAQHALRIRADGSYELKFDPAIATTPDEIDETAWWTAVRSVPCPVLVVRGAGSAVLSPQFAHRIAGSCVNGALSVVAMAGHGVMIDNPPAFAATVLKFFDRWREWRTPCAS